MGREMLSVTCTAYLLASVALPKEVFPCSFPKPCLTSDLFGSATVF